MKQLSFLDRHLTWWILGAMAAGLALGKFLPAVPQALQGMSWGATNIPIAIGLMVMMYPPLAKANYRLMPKVFQNVKLVGFSLALNWIVGPILMFGLAVVFLHDEPGYMSGLILIGLARCIAMVLVWNDLAEGNRELAAGLVAVNSLFQVVAYSFYAWLFMSELPAVLGIQSMALNVPMSLVAETVALYLGVPFVLGALSREVAVRKKGEEWFNREFVPRISPWTLVALLFTIVVMFSLKGDQILALPLDVVRVSLPLILYFGLMFLVSMLLGRRMDACHADCTAVAFTASGNNFELAIAVAVAMFGIDSEQAFVGVVGPLIEVPALLVMVWVSRAFKPGS